MNKKAIIGLTALIVFVFVTFNSRVYASGQMNNANTSEIIQMDGASNNNQDNTQVNTNTAEPEGTQTDNKDNTDSEKENSTENTPENPKEPQEDEGKALETEKTVQAKRIIVGSISVINTIETSYVNIKQNPSLKSRTIGIIYGNLTAVKVINRSGVYSYIEAMDYKTNRLVRGYVLSRQIKTRIPNKQYQVIVDISDQKIYVYNYENLERVFSCSTGKSGSITPEGMYLIGKRGSSFYSKKYSQGGYNWVRFNYNFLFHSVPFDKNRIIIPEEVQRLGQQASHGCVRLSMEDSKWFYQTITEGSLVIVQQ